MYPLSRTPAQSIDKAQNTMADIGLATCRNWYKSEVNENSKNNSDFAESFSWSPHPADKRRFAKIIAG